MKYIGQPSLFFGGLVALAALYFWLGQVNEFHEWLILFFGVAAVLVIGFFWLISLKQKYVKAIIGDFSELLPEISLNPITVQVLRFLLSIIMSCIFYATMFVVEKLIVGDQQYDELHYFTIIALVVIFWIFFKRSEEKISVPRQHVRIITFLGTELPIYLVDGEYTWYGQPFLFDISGHPGVPPKLAGNNFVTEHETLPGMINIAVRTLPIWPSPDNKVTGITLLARDKVNVKANYALSIRTDHPILWIRFNDTILQICNRARSAINELVALFISTDFNDIVHESQELLKGNRVIFAFAVKEEGSIKIASIARDRKGKPLSYVIEMDDDMTPEDYAKKEEESIRDFTELFKKEVASDKIELFMDHNSEIEISVTKLSNSIKEIVYETGSVITQIAVDSIILPLKVVSAIEQQKIEEYEMKSEAATVDSIIANAERMPTADKELALSISAANSKIKGVRVNYVSGNASPFEKATALGMNKVDDDEDGDGDSN